MFERHEIRRITEEDRAAAKARAKKTFRARLKAAQRKAIST